MVTTIATLKILQTFKSHCVITFILEYNRLKMISIHEPILTL